MKTFYLFSNLSFIEKEIPVHGGPLYKNPDSHSRKVHEQALTGMFGKYSQTSMARTFLGPGKLVRDRGRSSQ